MYQPVRGHWVGLVKLGGSLVPRRNYLIEFLWFHRLKYLIELSLNMFSLTAYTCTHWRW